MQIRLVQGIEQIDADAWQACAGAGNPFVSHRFLHLLEESGSVGRRTGWLPVHAVVEDEDTGEVLACCPLYLKNHSYGEYVFDWGWADAYHRAGGSYYPKLQAAVPFTPVPGPRLLVKPGPRSDEARGGLMQGLAAALEQLDASSVHLTFCQEDDYRALGDAGYLQRQGVQYHWFNENYATFDAFLDDLKSSKRKTIKKERRAVQEAGVCLRALTGDDLKPEHWDTFWPFYLNTVDKRWGSAYLNRAFFRLLGERMADDVLLILAERDGDAIGGALNLIGADTLYGRVWGCSEDVPFLHFEACYYAAIDFAIERKLARVEAGAQGQHKIARGYRPVPTYSAHLLTDPRLADAVAHFVARERQQIAHEIEALATLLPFKEHCARAETLL